MWHLALDFRQDARYSDPDEAARSSGMAAAQAPANWQIRRGESLRQRLTGIRYWMGEEGGCSMTCKARLETYLRENGVGFQAMTHPTAYTAQEVAAAQGVPGKQVAKVVMVLAEAKPVMLVMPASYRADFTRLKSVLNTGEVRLAAEKEFAALFPDCEAGAMPPFGNLYHVPVYVDRALAEDAEIVFQAGTHRDTIKIAYPDYARLAQPVVAEFAMHL